MDKMQCGLLVSGAGCPMDAPRPASTEFWDLVAALSVSSLYLAKNQTYRGQCSLIWTTALSAMADTRLEINDHKALLQQLQAAAR
jgi:hypothetical protein